MYKIKIVTNTDNMKWDSNLLKSHYSTYFQTSKYIEVNKKREYFPIFIYIIDDNDIVVAQLVIQIIKTSVFL